MGWDTLVPDLTSSFAKATLDRRDKELITEICCILPLSQTLSFLVPSPLWLISPSGRRIRRWVSRCPLAK